MIFYFNTFMSNIISSCLLGNQPMISRLTWVNITDLPTGPVLHLRFDKKLLNTKMRVEIEFLQNF